MRQRLSFPYLISFLIFTPVMAGTVTIQQGSSPTAQQVRLMDYLRLYVSAKDDGDASIPLVYEWTIAQDPTAKAYFRSNHHTAFTGGGAVELAFPWISNSDAVNTPFVGQSIEVVVIAKHENAADGPETDSRTFDITISGINHPPVPVIGGTLGTPTNRIRSGQGVIASSGSSYDPDPRDTYRSDWTVGAPIGGTLLGGITIIGSEGSTMSFTVPDMTGNVDLPVILQLTDGMHQVRITALACLKPAGPECQCLVLNNSRFTVEVTWSTTDATGKGTPVPLSSDSGYFWFFEPTNLELVVKVLDGRTVNDHFWVFYGSLTDVQFTLTVTDTVTGAVKLYQGQGGRQSGGNDINAF